MTIYFHPKNFYLTFFSVCHLTLDRYKLKVPFFLETIKVVEVNLNI